MECQEASVPLRQLKAVLVEVLEATGSGGTSNALERGRLDDTTGVWSNASGLGAMASSNPQ